MNSTAPPFVLRLSKDERGVFQQNHNEGPDPAAGTPILGGSEENKSLPPIEMPAKFFAESAG